MKDKVMDALQRFSKAMFIPVLILPIAGILIAVGNLFTNVRLQAVLPFLNNPVTIGFGTLLSGSLNAILGNLGVIFCVGLSVGLANKKKSEAGFISLLAFLVFLNAMNKFMNMRGMLVEGSLSGTGQAMVLGVQVLDMGVFIGLLLGIVVAYIHNRFCETEFNNAFQIYGGTRFVFIVLIPVMVVKILDEETSIQREFAMIKVMAVDRTTRDEISQMANIFRANIIDVSRETLTVAIFGDRDKTEALVRLLRDFGVLEIARTGTIAIERGRSTIYDDNKIKEEYNYGKNVL